MDTMEQRRNTIVDLVNQSGNVSFAQLKKKFPQISEMTLRTDLKVLDEAKRIVRVHGGQSRWMSWSGRMICSAADRCAISRQSR